MSRQRRMTSKSGYYHVMIRGNEKKDIFHDDMDKMKFINTIYKVQQENRFFLHAFCLMNNHLHMMMSEGIEDLAKIMKRITVTYVAYFNKKYKRVGHLFQDRFKSEIVQDDRYVLTLLRYIHQNPIKANLAKTADDYKWSSHRCYAGKRSEFAKVLNLDDILGIFSEDRTDAIMLYEKYMMKDVNESCSEFHNEPFIEIEPEKDAISEDAARRLYEEMLSERTEADGKQLKGIIKEFRKKTNLPIRKIAAITGLQKDKVNKLLNS